VCAQFFRKLLEQEVFYAIDSYDGRADYNTFMHTFSTPQCIRVFLQDLTVPLHTISLPQRFECAMHLDWNVVSARQFMNVCGVAEVTSELATASIRVGFTALHFAAKAIYSSSRPPDSVDEWRQMVRDLINVGANLHHAGARSWGTRLLMILCWERDTIFELMFQNLRDWAGLLGSAGVDILEYGREESKRLAALRAVFENTQLREFGVGQDYALWDINPDPDPSAWSFTLRCT
jgi:hypothetical protein